MIAILALCVSCGANIHSIYHVDHLNSSTPSEGKGDIPWINAMLSTIETEHIMRGDSVNLSPFYVIRNYIERGYKKGDAALSDYRHGDNDFPGSPMLLIEIIEKWGIVPFDSYSRSPQEPPPLHVFMLGAEYSPQEFARSVCAPGEYSQLSADDCPADSLLSITIKAVANNHGVCWQPRDNDCKAIVGLAHDDNGNRYLIMKDSTGLVYISYREFLEQTKNVVLAWSDF